MKQFIFLYVMILSLLLAVCGCSNGLNPPEEEPPVIPPTTAPTENNFILINELRTEFSNSKSYGNLWRFTTFRRRRNVGR
jgi:hypothetical protein